jgi:hypothetical protein
MIWILAMILMELSGSATSSQTLVVVFRHPEDTSTFLVISKQNTLSQ